MQRKILFTAKGMGYFDDGHTVTIEDIGKALGISKSTAHHHLKEAKRKLVSKYIFEYQENQLREDL
ncbi:helix-turn-helix domain-containing protein [Methanolobus sp. WCC4]|uniref:helix-turn-helix domain-containing protein n=1 Tax=Methanolobus sp. WCC4 TaxID=3125784 RepID=UPI0030FC5AC2